MNSSIHKSFDKRITLYGFVLTIAVIWVHAVEPGFAAGLASARDGSLFASAERLLGNGLGQLAVPGFFCMSGYLFFSNMGTECGQAELMQSFKAKLTSRIYSLLLPYILWNVIYYLIYLALGRAELSVVAFISAVMDYSFNPVFWYLHELILITLITPLIYVLTRNKYMAAAVLLSLFAAAVFYERLSFHYANEDALFYYTFGGACALHLSKYAHRAEYIGRAGAACFLIFVICTEAKASLYSYGYMAAVILGRLSGLLGVFACCCAAVRRDKDKTGLPIYMRYNFFIYAVHYLELRLIQWAFGLLSVAVSGRALFDNDILSAAVYVAMPLMCIAISVAAGSLMQRHAPRLYGVLTGGRS